MNIRDACQESWETGQLIYRPVTGDKYYLRPQGNDGEMIVCNKDGSFVRGWDPNLAELTTTDWKLTTISNSGKKKKQTSNKNSTSASKNYMDLTIDMVIKEIIRRLSTKEGDFK